jgi:hypothetical protein
MSNQDDYQEIGGLRIRMPRDWRKNGPRRSRRSRRETKMLRALERDEGKIQKWKRERWPEL